MLVTKEAEETKRRGALRDLMFTNMEGLVGDVKIEGSLGPR